MEKVIDELKKIRKELWQNYHISGQWEKQKEVCYRIDEAIKKLEEVQIRLG
jgi:hypothetical protein